MKKHKNNSRIKGNTILLLKKGRKKWPNRRPSVNETINFRDMLCQNTIVVWFVSVNSNYTPLEQKYKVQLT